jgi:AraC family transcriptional regulator
LNEHIGKALYHIETHLDDVLNVKTLARVAGYSPYHFCRAFKASVGESVISYATRLRIERATLKMMNNDRSIIQIALEAGFETPNGFNKAFKKIFCLTPTEYKKQQLNLLQNYKDKMMQAPKIVTRDEKFVVYERECGGYEKSSDIAWKKLSKELNDLGEKLKNNPDSDCKDTIILDTKDAELLGICHDDPTVTDEKNIRYDAAIAWDKKKIDFLKEQGFNTKKIEGGKYAMVLYKGNYEKAIDSWSGIYNWIGENGYKFKDSPPFERYLNTPNEVSEDKLLTEIYVPLEDS